VRRLVLVTDRDEAQVLFDAGLLYYNWHEYGWKLDTTSSPHQMPVDRFRALSEDGRYGYYVEDDEDE